MDVVGGVVLCVITIKVRSFSSTGGNCVKQSNLFF